METARRKVIVITDGDQIAKKAVEQVARRVSGRCISLSAGNPTPLTGPEIVELIKAAKHDPVLVMLDDRGSRAKGKGEKALEYLAKHPEIEILGVIAVASNTDHTQGVVVDHSITKEGKVINRAVDKEGNPKVFNACVLEGDTVDILNELDIPLIIGTGDTGKMDGADSLQKQVPITTKAVEEILNRNENKNGYYR